jgi:hypothetical protein
MERNVSFGRKENHPRKNQPEKLEEKSKIEIE